ncbi:MAG: hypothetical protein ACOYK7_05715, partial [Pirellulales bacterium]
MRHHAGACGRALFATGLMTMVAPWAVLLGGCGGAASRAVLPDGPALAAQVAAVRAGTATTIHLTGALSGAEAWESLRGLGGLRELILDRGRADDAAATILATLPDLERLVLRESPVGDEGLAVLAGL